MEKIYRLLIKGKEAKILHVPKNSKTYTQSEIYEFESLQETFKKIDHLSLNYSGKIERPVMVQTIPTMGNSKSEILDYCSKIPDFDYSFHDTKQELIDKIQEYFQ